MCSNKNNNSSKEDNIYRNKTSITTIMRIYKTPERVITTPTTTQQ